MNMYGKFDIKEAVKDDKKAHFQFLQIMNYGIVQRKVICFQFL